MTKQPQKELGEKKIDFKCNKCLKDGEFKDGAYVCV